MLPAVPLLPACLVLALVAGHAHAQAGQAEFGKAEPAPVVARSLHEAQAAGAGPLSAAELLRLADESVGERVIRLLVRKSGLAEALSLDDVIDLTRAGLSEGLVEFLLTQPPRATRSVDQGDVSYTHREGVLVVRAKGEPDDLSARPASENEARRSEEPAPRFAAPAPSPAPTVVVVQAPGPGYPPAGGQEQDRGVAGSGGYPVGATFGGTGGVVFLPHGFGDAPSRLGTTVIQSSPVALLPGVSPWWTSPAPPALTAPAPAWDGVVGPPYGTYDFRTSRGVVKVPH